MDLNFFELVALESSTSSIIKKWRQLPGGRISDTVLGEINVLKDKEKELYNGKTLGVLYDEVINRIELDWRGKVSKHFIHHFSDGRTGEDYDSLTGSLEDATKDTVIECISSAPFSIYQYQPKKEHPHVYLFPTSDATAALGVKHLGDKSNALLVTLWESGAYRDPFSRMLQIIIFTILGLPISERKNKW